MSESGEPETCCRWSCNFIVAHAVLATGFITAPVAVLHILRRPHSGAAATFFAMFSIFCAAISSILCCRFYTELKRPPWPRWLIASASGTQQLDGGGAGAGAGEGSARREMSHGLRQPDELPVMARLEMQAALATDRVPSYEHRDGAMDCAVFLGEVEKGETVRRLPACRHVFHRECIDMWLRAHATCPLCRSGVMAPERPPEVLVNVEAVNVPPGLRIPARGNVVFPGQSDLGLWFGPASRLN